MLACLILVDVLWYILVFVVLMVIVYHEVLEESTWL